MTDNKFVRALDLNSAKTLTENGAVSYNTTFSGLIDLFGMGAAYRTRSDADCINLFKKAFNEDKTYAMKCLFYLRDILEGQGERRFFRTVIRWLANEHTDIMRRNLRHIPFYGRWDDLYAFVGTPLEEEAFNFINDQLVLDWSCKTPSLLAKWLKSENTSSKESRRLATITRSHLGLTPRDYRKTLSILRERINVLERLMSAGKWEEIEFDKIPSRAGMIYRNAFARHDVERVKAGAAKTYEDFAKDKTTKVNAKALYPYDVVKQAMAFNPSWGYYFSNKGRKSQDLNDTERLMVNKYWENLTDTLNGYSFNGICVADTSGSMYGDPLAVALSIAMYCAERNKGPYANRFITFSDRPTCIKVEGVDFVDKINRMSNADWNSSTNVEAVFDMLLNIAKREHCTQDEIPQTVIIISDMEFNCCASCNTRQRYSYSSFRRDSVDETLFENIEKRWNAAGYKMPTLCFWNVNARHDLIPMRTEGHVTYVSGMSPSIFQQVMTNKSAADLVKEKLDSERYARIK